MIKPKGFFALVVPLTLSVYSLLLNVWGIANIPIPTWGSVVLTIVFGTVVVVSLLRLSEREEEKLLSDHMNIQN